MLLVLIAQSICLLLLLHFQCVMDIFLPTVRNYAVREQETFWQLSMRQLIFGSSDGMYMCLGEVEGGL